MIIWQLSKGLIVLEITFSFQSAHKTNWLLCHPNLPHCYLFYLFPKENASFYWRRNTRNEENNSSILRVFFRNTDKIQCWMNILGRFCKLWHAFPLEQMLNFNLLIKKCRKLLKKIVSKVSTSCLNKIFVGIILKYKADLKKETYKKSFN